MEDKSNVEHLSATTRETLSSAERVSESHGVHGKEEEIKAETQHHGISPDEEAGKSRDRNEGDSGEEKSFFSRFYQKYRPFFHITIWMVWTAWWIHGLIFHRSDNLGWLIPFLLYLAVTMRLLFFWLPVRVVWNPVRIAWKHTFRRVYDLIPSKLHKPLAAIVTVAIFLVGSLVPKESGLNTRASRAISLFGLIVMIACLYATSRNRKMIPWHSVIGGMLTQFIIAVFVLKTSVGYDIFEFISSLARTLLQFANHGVVFLTDDTVPKLPWFLIGVVPPIIFFVSLVSLLYHANILQWFIQKFGRFFFWTLRVSGAEAVVAASTPFVGQGESAMLIRPFIPHLTLAEIHQVMTCGFATISGSMLVAYIGLGLSPQALVSSCIMSIPASIAVSKLRYPETEQTLTSGNIVVPVVEEDKTTNALHAFANGAWLGLKIAGMIVTTLLCIIAFIALINGFLTWWGKYWNLTDPELTLQLILGYLMYPVAWLLGVPSQDLRATGELIGLKIISNEFLAFSALSQDEPYVNMSSRAKLIATYACCGFGNIGSLGTQMGVLSQIAPGRAGDISRVAVSALFSGVLSTLTSASVAGMLFSEDMSPVNN
ncbi:putative sodium nucleoside cotransporter 1 [Ilyonectria robusta]